MLPMLLDRRPLVWLLWGAAAGSALVGHASGHEPVVEVYWRAGVQQEQPHRVRQRLSQRHSAVQRDVQAALFVWKPIARTAAATRTSRRHVGRAMDWLWTLV